MKKLIDNHLDPNGFACIEGGIDVASELNRQKVDVFCFTGSTFVGKIIAQTAAKNLIPCILELGGKCPAIVDKSADLDFATTRLADVKFANSGQTCIAPDYALIHKSKLEDFIIAYLAKIKRLYSEDPITSDNYARMINEFHTKRVEDLIKTSGGKIIHGGKVIVEEKFIEPTLILNPDKDSKLMQEEIFGPVLPIYTFTDIDEVENFIADREKPLSVYYFGDENGPNAIQLARRTSSGSFVANECMI